MNDALLFSYFTHVRALHDPETPAHERDGHADYLRWMAESNPRLYPVIVNDLQIELRRHQ